MRGLAITFDDGPDEHWTPAILDSLARHRARATFFVIGPRAVAQPDLVRRMLEHGHTVGLHCDLHVRHSHRDQSWLERDTERALDGLRRVGVTPTLWRTPWGDTAPWSVSIADRHGLRLIHWTVDTHDWRGDSATEMFSATSAQLVPGAIVLAHDGIGPGAMRDGAAETVAYLDLLARHATEHDLTLEALA